MQMVTRYKASWERRILMAAMLVLLLPSVIPSTVLADSVGRVSYPIVVAQAGGGTCESPFAGGNDRVDLDDLTRRERMVVHPLDVTSAVLVGLLLLLIAESFFANRFYKRVAACAEGMPHGSAP